MKISAEANLSQMLEFFESFLRAAGYQLDGQTLTLLTEEEAFPSVNDNFWEDDGFSFTGNPYISTRVPGGEDRISFSPAFGNSVVTFS
jgi:hypothetical protein